MHDPALEAAFAERREWAYEAAYRRFGGRLYAIARHVLRDSQAAQDCVHDVLLRLWKKPNAYTPERGLLQAFLATCVRNDALARVRSEARRTQLRLLVAPDAESYDLEVDPVESARIDRAIGELTDLQRQMIQLAYFRGMTHKEIATQLDEPVGTVKSRLASALRALRTSLGTTGASHAG